MKKRYILKNLTILLLFSPVTSLFASTHGALADTYFSSKNSSGNEFLFIAEAGGENQVNSEGSGPLILPEDGSDKSKTKCMKVCEKWGEDCVINPRTGTRKCRKVCKNFGEECF